MGDIANNKSTLKTLPEVGSKERKFEEYEYAYMEESFDKDDASLSKIERMAQMSLKEVREELCLIDLCWSVIDINADVYLSSLSPSYSSINNKESLLLWYAENFRKQFRTIYSNRQPLLMVAETECGIQKFVSTSIRRSTLPYPELSTWRGCAKFVADYISYEPPEKALVMPKRLRSPTWLQRFRKGNNFECATFLVSLLLGQGYNAYVVSGYASLEQILCDMTRRPCPYLPEAKQPPTELKAETYSKYRVKPPPDFKSQFLLELETREKRRREAELQRQEEERQKMIFELEQPQPDPYWGWRIHAWVVVLPNEKGARWEEVPKPFFIEPSSGTSYCPTDRHTNLLYLGVESVWNDRNYWVNMQTCEEGCAKINWDLTKVEFWEHLLPGEPPTIHDVTSFDPDDESNIEKARHLDMPHSYVDEIRIDRSEYERRYPNGSKTMFYKKTKVELYAPRVHVDGMVQRLTLYDDYEYQSPIQVYEKFLHRADHLVESRKNFDIDEVSDYYERGRSDACKEHRYSSSNANKAEERTLEFYDTVRADGLSRIEMRPSFLTQHYHNREDMLYYRHVEFHTNNKEKTKQEDLHHRQIWKVTEKYHRNEELPAHKDIAIREFAIGKNEIHLKYHYEENRITRATRTFIKPLMSERGERLVFNPDMFSEYNPNPLTPPAKFVDLYCELEKQLKDKDLCMTRIRDAELEILTFLKTRTEEFTTPKLTVPLFNVNRVFGDKSQIPEKDEMSRIESDREVSDEPDFLEPYLARIGNPPQISKAEAYLLQDECLNDFKSLLVKRANHTLRQYEEYKKELQKLQETLTKIEDLPPEEKGSVLKKINEIQLNLDILELRLDRHKELSNVRYEMLLNKLRQNRHLAVLQQE